MLVEAVECLEDGSVKVLKCLVSTDLDGAGNDQAFKLVTCWPSNQVDDQGVQPGGSLALYVLFDFRIFFPLWGISFDIDYALRYAFRMELA